jgi:radical SAM superfamily enzyme YgiQ (UPF0313 family)
MSTKILLCSLPITAVGEKFRPQNLGKSYRQPRLGIQAIRDSLIVDGCYSPNNIDFFDIEMLEPSDELIKSTIKKINPDIVGLSAVLSLSYQQVKRITKIIREECSETVIVVGGHLTASADVLLNKTATDVCVVGDGERPFLSLVKHVEKKSRDLDSRFLESVPGLAYLDDRGKTSFSGYPRKSPTEVIPMPDYRFFESGLLENTQLIDLYFPPALGMGAWFKLDPRASEEHRRPNSAQVPTTKGCTARCTFCQRSTRGYRLANISDMDSHLEEIIEKHNVGFVSVLDENFGGRRDQAYAFADLMDKHGLIWVASGVRCTNVTREDIQYYKQRGCAGLKFGVESGSQKILDMMEKNFTKDDVEKAITACWEEGIYSPLAMMVGMPGEDKETVRESGEFIGKLQKNLGIHPDIMELALFYALPFPGTPLYTHCVQSGLIDESIEAGENYLIGLANATTSKWHYLNVNGAKARDILTWDILVRWEAAKAYETLEKKEKSEYSEFAKRWKDHQVKTINVSKKNKLRLNRLISLYGVTLFLEKFYETRFVRKLPRYFAYPLIKWTYFLAILSYVFLGKIFNIGSRKFLLYKDQPTPPSFIAPDSKEKRLEKSLRAIVRKSQSEELTPREALQKGAAG